MTLGERIRRARMLAGLTQQQLARQVDADLRSVGAWERDENVPRNIAKLEAVLGPLRDEDAQRHPAMMTIHTEGGADRYVDLNKIIEGYMRGAMPIDQFSNAALVGEIARRLEHQIQAGGRHAQASEPQQGQGGAQGSGAAGAGGSGGAAIDDDESTRQDEDHDAVPGSAAGEGEPPESARRHADEWLPPSHDGERPTGTESPEG